MPKQQLLNIDGNAKTVKGQKQGYMTAVLYLQPSSKLCPSASKGCLKACLNTAGRGGLSRVQDARRKKTQYFMTDRQGFMFQLDDEILKFINKASKRGLIPVVRLNGTSDIDWTTIEIKRKILRHGMFGGFKGKYTTHENIFEAFPGVQFYDYTKRLDVLRQSKLIPNYHLTFSRNESNQSDCSDAIQMGFNVAVVYSKDALKQLKHLAQGWLADSEGFIDGDAHDLRFLNLPALTFPHHRSKTENLSSLGRIIMLSAKGKARKDQSGFAVQAKLSGRLTGKA